MQLELTDDEARLLREVLETAFGELREEVVKTEGAEWKRALKGREQVLAGIIAKLRTA